MEGAVTATGSEHTGSRMTLDREERSVKDGILRMGSLVEQQIRDAVQAVVHRDPDLAERVIAGDVRINDAQREIAEMILTTIATQSPVARDIKSVSRNC